MMTSRGATRSATWPAEPMQIPSTKVHLVLPSEVSSGEENTTFSPASCQIKPLSDVLMEAMPVTMPTLEPD